MRIDKSLPQYEIWLDNIDNSNTPLYNIGGIGLINGRCNHKLLKESLNILIESSTSLRITLNRDNSLELKNRVDTPIEFIKFEDEKSLMEYSQIEFNRAFRIYEDKALWRVYVLYIDENYSYLTLKFHHIIMDGWGTSIFIQQWAKIYTALENRTYQKLQKRYIDYLDFISETNEYLNSNLYKKSREFWKLKLKNIDLTLLNRRYGGIRESGIYDAFIYKDYIKNQKENFSHYHIFLCALSIYFSSILKRDRVVIGVPTLNRGGKRYKNTLGVFVNINPLVILIDRKKSIVDLYEGIKRELQEIYRHSKYPISHIFKDLNLISKQKKRLFDIVVSFERQDYAVNFGEAYLKNTYQLFSSVAKYPLGITISDFHHKQDIEIIYHSAKDFFSYQDIELFSHRIRHISNQIIDSPTIAIDSIELIPNTEIEQIKSISKEKLCRPIEDIVTFIELFEKEVKREPQKVALLFGDYKLTYGELNQEANRLAHHIIDRYRLSSGDVVAILLNRSFEMVFSLLAISKCSCIFLILDIDSPPNRIYKILKRAKVKLLITESNLSFEFETIDYKILNIDTLQKENLSSENLKIKPQLDTLAYLIFTSGSSGEPKGVMVSHMALAYRLRWIRENFKIDSTDCFAQSIQPTFDPFFIELLAPLSAGCLVALSPKGKSSAKVLVEFAIKYQITFMAFVPSTLESFLIEAKKHKGLNLKRACTGGETLKPTLFKLFKDVVKDGELFNVYGPTEACIFSTAWRCYELLDGNDFPIGEPIDGTYIYILNSDMRRVPIGEIGEIFIGGFGLAIGYLDDIELTKKRFVKNPFIEGEKLYATGDYGYFGADNNIYFKGRIDRQKKIDGYRIELEEIETSIKRIDSVKKTAVKIIKSNGKADICGWIVLRDELLNISKETHLNLIFENLNRELPFYMIPKRIFIVDEIFNDRNGKIDYKALITPKDEVIESRDSLTELEERLISIYKDVLNLDSIDVNDNFFEMGGDSLSALSVMVEIDKINGKKNSLLLILENQTIKKLASTLSKSIDTENICISFNREKNRKTLLIVSSKEGDIIRFRGLTTILQSSYNLSILQPLESMNYSSIEELAYIYSKNIPRELLYNQEITVIGFSIGGVVALELSRELKRLNLNLNRLVLIDSLFPNLLFRNIFGVKAILPVFERFNLLKGSLVRQMELLSNYRVKTLDIKSTLIISSKLSIFYKFIFKNWGKYINIDNIEMLDGFHGTLFGKNSADKLAKIVEEN